MSKFFKYPFAQTGDTTNIPDDSAGDEVSYADGFTPAYELPYSQAGSKDIPRQVLNGILNDITSAIAEMQKQGIATWAEVGKPYPKGALAQKNGINYVSKVENNNQEPPGANWDTLGEGSSVPPGRTISTSAPLAGGGDLSANRTLSINAAGAATTTASGTPGSVTYAPDNNTTARNMAATPAGVAKQVNDAVISSGSVPPGRTISTSAPLAGGGDLSANRTLSINAAGAATETANGTPGSVVYAAHNNKVAQNMAATPANVAKQIASLELGTAATRYVGTNSGNVMEVGAFGIGNSGRGNRFNPQNATDWQNLPQGFRAFLMNAAVGKPPGLFHGYLTVIARRDQGDQCGLYVQEYNGVRAWVGEQRDGQLPVWAEFLHTGNILSTTGQSTEYPMTQKAVTDALANANYVKPSRAIATIAPLAGGGTLSANRALAINAASAATETASGTPGSVTYAPDNNTTARNMAATPAGVAAQIAALGGGGLKDIKIYASSGTYTVPAGVKKIMVIAVGAGGSGGQLNLGIEHQIGGGGGGWGLRLYNVTPGGTYAMVVGAGGQRTESGPGNKGGNTTFGGSNGVGGSGGMGGISGRHAAGGTHMGGAIVGGNGGPGLRTVDGAIGGSCFFSGPTIGNEGGAGTGGGYSGSGTSKGGVGFIMVFEYQ